MRWRHSVKEEEKPDKEFSEVLDKINYQAHKLQDTVNDMKDSLKDYDRWRNEHE